MSGQMAEDTTDNGKTTICMARESTPGKMVGSTRESTLMIAKMDSEHTLGLMGDSIEVTGRMESSMQKDGIDLQMGKREEVFGTKERE
jgi:hypothetical protein